jgi:PAS domain S-box-containing protein
MMRGLKLQLNLLAIGVILAVALFISLAALVAMERLAHQLSAERMQSELGWIRFAVDDTHRILKDTGVDTLKPYLDSAQQEIIQKFRDFRIGETGRLYIVSDDGRIVSTPSDRQITDLDGPALEQITRKKSGYVTLEIAGSPSIVYFDSFPEWRWWILLAMSEKEINATRDNFLLMSILILIFSTCAGVFVFARAASRFVLPILELAKKISRMKEDQLGRQLEVTHRSKEVGILISAFNNLSGRLLAASKTLQEQYDELQIREEKLQRQNDELISVAAMLRQSEQRQRSILQTAMDGIWLTDTQGRFVEVNETYCQMSGYSMQELLTMSVADIEHLETASVISSRIAKTMEQGDDRFESQHRRKDGSVYDVEVSMQYRSINGGQFVVFVQDITERKQAQWKLEQKNQELEQFVYSVSHDLKSPLVTVSTYAGMLRQDLLDTDQQQVFEDLKYIDKAANKMQQLLDALLQYSRIGRIDTPAQTQTACQLVNDNLDTLAGILQEHQVEISTSKLPHLLHGNPMHFGQIWQNLIENAVKYRGEQTQLHIKIGATQEGKDVVFYVRDNGMGIAPENNGRIFDLFSQLNPGSGGIGLGLALVKKIVSIYQGRIWVESEGKDKGSCFYFTLPGATISKVALI